MIDENTTFALFEYYPSELKPRSNKIIISVCDKCGRVREIIKFGYCDLCSSCAHIGLTHTDKTKKKMAETHTGFIHTDESKKKMSDAKIGHIVTDELKKKMSEALIGHIVTDETKMKMSEAKIGENHPNWKGGISNDEYCHLFNESLKEAHRRYFDYKCFMDNEPEENGRKLSDHHVGYDKRCGCNATQFCIFVPVKAKWNMKFNGSNKYNRWYWYSFLMIKIFTEYPNYFAYHIPVWGMDTLEYNYSYVFEKVRRK